jgi:hypothetical protein
MFLVWQQPTDRALAGWCPNSAWPLIMKRPDAEKTMRSIIVSYVEDD